MQVHIVTKLRDKDYGENEISFRYLYIYNYIYIIYHIIMVNIMKLQMKMIWEKYYQMTQCMKWKVLQKKTIM